MLAGQLSRAVGARAQGQIGPALLQRNVGFEFQMLKTTIPGAVKNRFPVEMDDWELQADGANLEFVIDHTADRMQMDRRLTEVAQVAGHFLPGIATHPFVVAPTNWQALNDNQADLEAIRAATGVAQGTGQPQINADVRIDDVDLFFAAFDAHDVPARGFFAHSLSFPSWGTTAAELDYATANFRLLSYDQLAPVVNPVTPADTGVEIAKVRGLVRLMFQYLVHGRQEFQPPEDFMKDLPYLSKSNMGLASRQIRWATRYVHPSEGDKGSVVDWLTAQLAQMTGRKASTKVFAGMSDVPTIQQWVAGIIKGDDQLGSLQEVVTRLTQPIAAADTTITVGGGDGALAMPFGITVGAPGHDERMIVTAGAGTTSWTVTRAADGSTARAHPARTTVLVPDYARGPSGTAPLATFKLGQKRLNFPTSLGGLGLAGATAVPRASAPAQTAPIPTIIVEFRRLAEIPGGQWRASGLAWFDYFEQRRTQGPVQDQAPPTTAPQNVNVHS